MNTFVKAAGAAVLIFIALCCWILIFHELYVFVSTDWTPSPFGVVLGVFAFVAAVCSTAGAIVVIRS